MREKLRNIPRLVIAGTQSGVGKTTLTAGLIRTLRDQGLVVQPFKVGPDYIDPSFHSQAAGRQAHNLDSWLVGSEQIPELFASACEGADIAIIEGVMGLFDGGKDGRSSTAEIARILKAPILLVHNCQSAGESAGVSILGFYHYQPDLAPAGVILNRLGSTTHGEMIRTPLEERGVLVLAEVPRKPQLGLEERHLGLVPAAEENPEPIIEEAAKVVQEHFKLDEILKIAKNVEELTVFSGVSLGKKFEGIKIGIAKDEAFSFEYPASFEILEKLGAQLIYFSPIHDSMLPQVDGLIFGGGFPELFLPDLSKNIEMIEAIRRFQQEKRPIWAECGGFLYLCESLTDLTGEEFPLVGLIPAKTEMTGKLQAVGYVKATALADLLLLEKGQTAQGHHFHFSQMKPLIEDFPWAFSLVGRKGEVLDGYYQESLTASYLHIHLLGNPQIGERFLRICKERRESIALGSGEK